MKHKAYRIIRTDSVSYSRPIFVTTHLRKSFHSKSLLRSAFMCSYKDSYSRPAVYVSFITYLELICYYPGIPVY